MTRGDKFMEEERSHIKYFLIKLVVCVILGALIFAFREQLIANIKYFIGGLMIFYCVEEVLFELIYSRKHIFHKDKIYLAAIELTLGLVLIISNINYESVCVVWAVWSILRESYEIKEIIVELKCWVPRILSGLESIAVIVLSIMLILEPGEHHAMIHLYLLLVELPMSPLTPLLDEVLSRKKVQEE